MHMPLQGGLLLAALPNLYLNESPVNYVTDGNALSTYLISRVPKMDQTIMAIQTNSLSPLLLAMKDVSVRPSTLIKMDINTETEIKQKHSLTPSCFPNQPGISRAIFSQPFSGVQP